MPNKHAVSAISDPSGSGKNYAVLKEVHLDGTNDALLVCGGQMGPGKQIWVTVVAANTATQKDTAVQAALGV